MSKPTIALSEKELALLIEHFVVTGRASITCHDGSFNDTYRLLERITKTAKFLSIGGRVYRMLGVKPPRDTGGRDSHTAYDIDIELLDEDLQPNPAKVLEIEPLELPWLVNGVMVCFSNPVGAYETGTGMACRVAMLGGPLAVFRANVKTDSVELKIPNRPSVYLSRSKAERLLTCVATDTAKSASIFDYIQAYPEQKEVVLALLERELLTLR